MNAARRATAAAAGRRRPYLVALVLMGLGVVITAALSETGSQTMAPLVGAAAVAAWYGGARPALVAVAAGWAFGWFAFLDPTWSLGPPERSDVLAWLTTLAVSVLVVWIGWALERVGVEARERAESAERLQHSTEAVQLLAAELSSALTPSDVAHTLAERLPKLLGATGASLGLIDADVLQIVDPRGASTPQTLTPGLRLALETRALITVAARTGEVTLARNRVELERDFPDGAGLMPSVAGALAVPLRSSGTVIGSMGFPFAEPDSVDEDAIALARLAADLGGQALERARLYEQERRSRETLDRAARLAPRFGTESPASVLAAVCAEARRTFETDVAQIWAIEEDDFNVLLRDPPSDVLPHGTRVPVSDFPGLAASIQRLEPMFIPDSWTAVRGLALEHARQLGIRSSLRVPIAVGGVAERVLVLQWERVIGELPSSEIVIARRFADLAGLALEHAERRVAQVAASRNADETRRLLDVTRALAVALEPADVADATLRAAFRSLGATAGALVRRVGEHELELVAAVGYPQRVLDGWARFDLDADTPLCDAIRRNEVVALESPDEWARRYADQLRVGSGSAAWMALPLVAGGRDVGGVMLSFSEPRTFGDADRAFALALSRQAGQALERSSLLEAEHEARRRAERMASDLAQLHALATALGQAATAEDVTRIVGDQIVHGAGAESAGILTTAESGWELSLASVSGARPAGWLAEDGQTSLEADTPIAEAVREARPVWLVTPADWAVYEQAFALPDGEAGALGLVPLIVQQAVVGVLFAFFGGGRAPSDEDRRFIETVARQAAQPLERVRLLEEEREARLRAGRLQALTTDLSGALAPDDVVEVFLAQAAEALGASSIAVGLIDADGRIPRDTAWYGDVELLPYEWLEPPAGVATPVRDAIREGALYFDGTGELSARYPRVGPEPLRSAGALAFVPLLAGRKPCALTVLLRDADAPFVAGDRAFIEAISSQCGQALDRAQRYETERTIAETLQRSVLPETLPSMEGATVAARYLPGTAAIDVGGDWFDTIPLLDGRIGFVVGDVVGKGVQAASTMAQLRNGMRALTLDSSDVAGIVTKLNRLLDSYTDAPFATLAFVAIEPRTHEASIVSAGHLPVLVLSPDLEPRLLDGHRALPLGVDPDSTYEAWATTLEPGSVLVLYTDGLVERRDRPLDEGLALLVEATRGVEAEPDALVDLILERLIGTEERGDDVAVLAVALDRAPLGTFAVTLPADRDALVELRHSFGRWLDRGGIPDSDRRDLLLATWEASANAIEHAREPTEPSIEVEASLSGDKVRVEVSDRGQWAEPEQRPDRGLGLHLIQSLMTSMTVEPGPFGTRVVMERALSRERAGEGGAHASDNGRA